MRHKVCELEGLLLNAAVAKALGWKPPTPWTMMWVIPSSVAGLDGDLIDTSTFGTLQPWSTDWSHGGPIIERERIAVFFLGTAEARCVDGWRAEMPGGESLVGAGPTPLIAAMRAYVASKFGDEIDLP